MSVAVQITDQFGGYINSIKDESTGLITVNIFNGRTREETELLVNPENPEVMKWLKRVYQPMHLAILLGDSYIGIDKASQELHTL